MDVPLLAGALATGVAVPILTVLGARQFFPKTVARIVSSWAETRKARADAEVRAKDAETTGKHDLVELATAQSDKAFDRVLGLLEDATTRAEAAVERANAMAREAEELRASGAKTISELADAKREITALREERDRQRALKEKAEAQVVEMRRYIVQLESDREHRAAAGR